MVTFIELNADLDFDLCQSYPFANAVGGDVSLCMNVVVVEIRVHNGNYAVILFSASTSSCIRNVIKHVCILERMHFTIKTLYKCYR